MGTTFIEQDDRTLQLGLGGVIANGAGQFDFRVPVSILNLTLKEVVASLKTAGTTIDIQIEEFNSADVSQGVVLTSVIVLGANKVGSSTTFVAERDMPAIDSYYKINVTNVTGLPADLCVQLRF